jgi:hypothetical protein
VNTNWLPLTNTASANEKRVMRERQANLVARHEAKSKAAIKAEDIGRLEGYKLEACMRHQRREDLAKDKKKLFFTIWANLSEVSLQKVKEQSTVPVWLKASSTLKTL